MSAVIYPTSNLKQTELLSIARGEGIYVFDDRGRRYLEGLSGLWCTSLGYGNTELIEAITRAGYSARLRSEETHDLPDLAIEEGAIARRRFLWAANARSQTANSNRP